MRLVFVVRLALLASATEATLLHSSFRASRASKSRTTAYKACSCDCCLVQQENHARHSKAPGGLGCAPRSGVLIPGGADATDAGCADICMLPDSLRSSFKSESGEADYTRYCTEKCGPASTVVNDLCVDLADFDEGQQSHEVNQTAVTGARKSSQESAMTQMDSHVVLGAGSSEAIVQLAKQKMNEAKQMAEAAGRAAFSARMAFERLKRSTAEMAQKASEATLNEIKAEAAQTSKKAKLARKAYEDNAKATAIVNARNAAGVYQKAEVRDLALAAVWKERSLQFATAANQREQMAMDFSNLADTYRNRGQYQLAKDKMLLAHQAIDQAAAFGAQSDAAAKQSQAIANSKGWYEYAKQAIAANILAKSMPPDVPPPPLPALPR